MSTSFDAARLGSRLGAYVGVGHLSWDILEGVVGGSRVVLGWAWTRDRRGRVLAMDVAMRDLRAAKNG
jgi:hypothetical protein